MEKNDDTVPWMTENKSYFPKDFGGALQSEAT